MPAKKRQLKEIPIEQQIHAAKERHPGKVILFRVGDFYELHGDDADNVAPLLGLTVTKQNGQSMTGIICVRLESYLEKMLQIGLRVAICEPEEPALIIRKKDQTKTSKRKRG